MHLQTIKKCVECLISTLPSKEREAVTLSESAINAIKKPELV